MLANVFTLIHILLYKTHYRFMKESNQGNKQEFRESNKPQKDLSTRLAKGVTSAYFCSVFNFNFTDLYQMSALIEM